MYILCGSCTALLILVAVLFYKCIEIRQASEDICAQFAARLKEDTNVGIDVDCGDKYMRKLASDLNKQLAVLRKAHIRYTNGDMELKDAITNISHDLRTPLTAISGYMQLLEEEPVSDTAREYLDIIKNRIETMKSLTEELFRYSIIVSGEEDMTPEPVLLNRALEDCIAAFYGALTSRGITPEVEITDMPVKRRLHAASLSRALGNVMNNALKYSEGDLKIRLLEDGTITFSNRAKEMDEVTVGHLFERFFTLENARYSTGLGLSIARVLTEQMGGTVNAYKDGDLFTIEICLPG